MDEVADTILKHRLEDSLEDVPQALRHGKKILPLGRYLVRRLRTRIGREANAPISIQEAREAELQPLREIAFNTAKPGFKTLAFREALIKEVEGITIRMQHKYSYKQKGTI